MWRRLGTRHEKRLFSFCEVADVTLAGEKIKIFLHYETISE
jgi:hypothetical protein